MTPDELLTIIADEQTANHPAKTGRVVLAQQATVTIRRQGG